MENKYRITNEEIKAIPSDMRDRYIEETLNDLIKEKKDGVTIAEICRITGLTRNTIQRYIDRLTALNEIYKTQHGKSIVFHPNGRAMHPSMEKTIKTIDNEYKFTIINSSYGDSIFIQELKEGRFGKERKGGIIIKKRDLETFVNKLIEVKNEIGEMKNVS